MTALSYALSVSSVLSTRRTDSKTWRCFRRVKMNPGQTNTGPSQGDAALTLANELFRIYFFVRPSSALHPAHQDLATHYFAAQMNNLKLCDTVLSKIGSVEGQLDKRYPRSETVLYRYFRGRIFLYQRNLLQVRPLPPRTLESLLMCLAGGGRRRTTWRGRSTCVPPKASTTEGQPSPPSLPSRPQSSSAYCRRAILIYLVAVAIPVGRMPPRALLDAFNLSDQYSLLISAVKVRPRTPSSSFTTC